MWKYRCKSHLISLIVAFAIGAAFSYFSISRSINAYYYALPDEVVEMIKNNPFMITMAGGLGFAGIVNIIRLMELATNQWNISPYLILLFMIIAPTYFLLAGTILVIPAVIMCIVGMILLHRQKNSEFHNAHLSDESEWVRVYTLHHPLDTSVQSMAKAARKNTDRIAIAYGLGLVAIACVVFLITNIWIVVLAIVFFMFAFNILMRYRATNMIPIMSLLYEKCDPEACASAIIYYSTRKKKIHLQQHTLLAECLIYMDEPELAQDVMIFYPRKDRASNLSYWSIMSYVYYLLKDENSLKRCKEEANKLLSNRRMGVVHVVFENEELAEIQNKINLMNGDLNTCKKYYLNALRQAPHKYQQVDASYYIGLISFVQQDYPLADVYFKRVVNNGNKMHFVEKAQKYLDKLDNMDVNLEEAHL